MQTLNLFPKPNNHVYPSLKKFCIYNNTNSANKSDDTDSNNNCMLP